MGGRKVIQLKWKVQSVLTKNEKHADERARTVSV